MSKTVKLSELIPDDKNFNKGSEYGNSLIEKSFRKFGAGRSILLDKNNRIIAGNKSVENAGAIGLEEVQIVESDGKRIIAVKRTDIDLDSPEGREMALADNASAKANIVFDAELVEAELGEAVCEEWGVEVAENVEAKEDDYEIPDEITTDIVLGDLFEIGPHRLLCGDSTDSDAVAKLMDGQKADMVFTDPPYGYKYESNHQEKHKQLLNDDKILDFLPNVFLFSKKNIAVFVFCGWQTIRQWIDEILDNSFDLKNIIIWKKNNWSMGDLKGAYAGQYEIILFAHKGRVELKNGRGQDIWEFDRVPPKDHPTMKPIELIEKAIKDTTIKNELILDFFLGSGSTMVAAHQLNRKCYGMELDPKYCQVIIDRMLKLDQTLEIKKNGEKYNAETK